MNTCLSKSLKNIKITTQAPGRVDLGGGIDHRIISLISHSSNLVTFNIAVKLYTKITLESYKEGLILIDSDKIGSKEIIANNPVFNDKFALVIAIASFFKVNGVKISIKTEFPPMSGLGGSGSLSVALIYGFIKALNLESKYNQKDIVWLAHSIEDSLFKNTGLQDQAAACYGGINLFNWEYSKFSKIFDRNRIKNPSD
jgi:D-glycero-alpha-D-manno-heptose-7-phosphate kinase